MADWTVEEWAQRLDEVAGGRLGQYMRQGMIRVAFTAEREGKLNATAGRGGPDRRSGNLAASITGTVDTDGASSWPMVLLSAGGRGKTGPVPYAAIQERGGVVRPKRAKMLAIPLAPARTGAGVARYNSPRNVPGLRIHKSKAGNLLLVKDQGDRIEPWFALVDSVRIPPRPYLGPAIESAAKSAPPILRDRFTEALIDHG